MLLDEQLTAGLNPAQREAVLHVDGPLLVLAGAGSGKTRVLTTRIARLIDVEGVDPRQILAVTFTNKAAGEMRERIGRLLGVEPAGMWAGTFHAIGARMLRAAAHLVGRTPSFTIYDQDDSLGVIKRLMERHQHLARSNSRRAACSRAISDAKNALVTPAEYERLAMDPFAKAVAPVYRVARRRAADARTPSTSTICSCCPCACCSNIPTGSRSYRRPLPYILVDEYQDTNRAQYEFIKLLGGGHGNVCVVGDDDQSIYGWRGADIRNILDFNKDFPDAAVVRLEENYRSTPQILDLANVVISANTEPHGQDAARHARRQARRSPSCVRSTSATRPTSSSARSCAPRGIGRRRLQLNDVAILYRTNAQSRAMEEALRRHAMPYRLVGAVRFYDRREIRDLDGLPQAHRESRGRRSVPPRDRRAEARPRRHDDRACSPSRRGARAADVRAARSVDDIVPSLRPAARIALARVRRRRSSTLRERARDAAVDELLRELVEAIRYGDYLRAEGPESAERLDNVRELITSAAEHVADELGEVGLRPLDHFLQRAMLVAESTSSGGRRRGDADDAAQREGPRVSRRVHHRSRGRPLSARESVRRSGAARGRAALVLRRHHARREKTLPHVRRRAASQRRVPSVSRSRAFSTRFPSRMVEKRSTIKVRSSGRSMMRAGGDRAATAGATAAAPRSVAQCRRDSSAVRRRQRGARVAGDGRWRLDVGGR